MPNNLPDPNESVYSHISEARDLTPENWDWYCSLKKYRIKTPGNEQEGVMLEKWCELNKAHAVLPYILSYKPNEANYDLMQRDLIVAASLIQWLGTASGEAYLQSCGYELTRASEEKVPWVMADKRLPVADILSDDMGSYYHSQDVDASDGRRTYTAHLRIYLEEKEWSWWNSATGERLDGIKCWRPRG